MAKKTENIVFQGTGRRKESIARVRVMAGKGEVTVNGKKLDEYFGDSWKLYSKYIDENTKKSIERI